MSLKRRGKEGTWWVRFTAPSGKRICQSAKTTDRRQAEEYEARLKTQLWRVHQLGDKPRYTWEQAVVRWLHEQRDKTTVQSDVYNLRLLDRHMRGLHLDEISRPLIDSITESRIKDGVTNATVNRMLQVLRALLRRAHRDWEWVDRIPAVRLLRENNRRVRWLTHEEAARLLSELQPHMRVIAAFSLAPIVITAS